MQTEFNHPRTELPLLASWAAFDEKVARFREDCVGFQHQLQGLYSEMDLLYRTFRSQCLAAEAQQGQWEQRMTSLHQQNEELRQEIRQLRDLFNSRVDQVPELAK